MNINFATKITDKIFSYHLIGFNVTVTYDSKNRNLVLSEADTGAVTKIIEGAIDDEALTFEDFVMVSKNIYMDIIEISN